MSGSKIGLPVSSMPFAHVMFCTNGAADTNSPLVRSRT